MLPERGKLPAALAGAVVVVGQCACGWWCLCPMLSVIKLQFERSNTLLAACLSRVLPSPTLMHQACLAASAAFSTPAHMRGDRHTGGSSSGAAMVAAACIHGPALHR